MQILDKILQRSLVFYQGWQLSERKWWDEMWKKYDCERKADQRKVKYWVISRKKFFVASGNIDIFLHIAIFYHRLFWRNTDLALLDSLIFLKVIWEETRPVTNSLDQKSFYSWLFWYILINVSIPTSMLSVEDASHYCHLFKSRLSEKSPRRGWMCTKLLERLLIMFPSLIVVNSVNFSESTRD